MEYLKKLNRIKLNLDRCERVTRYSTKEEDQSDTLANSLIDIEESSRKIINKISGLYLKNLSVEEIDDVVLDIGEDLRHILYHINDTKVFDYLET